MMQRIMPPPLILYRFRYYDPLRRRLLVARHRLQEHEIRASYPGAELLEPPEVRVRLDSTRDMASTPPKPFG